MEEMLILHLLYSSEYREYKANLPCNYVGRNQLLSGNIIQIKLRRQIGR